MKRYAATAVSVLALTLAAIPCRAQFFKTLEKDLINGQGQNQQQQGMPGQLQGQNSLIGNVNLPPGQYMMTNVQSGQAFYVMVQGGQMFLSSQGGAPPMMAPGGMIQQQQQQPQQGGFGNFLKNQFSPQQGPNQ